MELRWRKHPYQRLLPQFECHTSATVLGKGLLEGAWAAWSSQCSREGAGLELRCS